MKRSAYPSLAEINVTNLVDVTLVLLIVFMLTAPFLQGGIEIDLPKADAKPIESRDALLVSVHADSSINVGDTAVKLDDLATHLGLVHPPGAKNPVFLKADQKIDYGFIVTLMSLMNKAGVEEVGLVSEPLPPEKTRGR